MSAPIILYDIPANDAVNKVAHPTVWKVRLALQYKGLAFKTEWLEYPDISAVSVKLGVSPNGKKPDGSPLYTVPIIYDPSTKTAISDSLRIAIYLDETYPHTTRLIPDGTRALHAAFDAAFMSTLAFPMAKTSVYLFWTMMNPRSQAYFRSTREAMLGMKLEEVSAPGPVEESNWKAAHDGLEKVAGWMTTDGGTKLGMGDNVCFADITVAAFLLSVKRALGEDSERFVTLISSRDGQWKSFLAQFEKYGK